MVKQHKAVHNCKGKKPLHGIPHLLQIKIRKVWNVFVFVTFQICNSKLCLMFASSLKKEHSILWIDKIKILILIIYAKYWVCEARLTLTLHITLSTSSPPWIKTKSYNFPSTLQLYTACWSLQKVLMNTLNFVVEGVTKVSKNWKTVNTFARNYCNFSFLLPHMPKLYISQLMSILFLFQCMWQLIFFFLPKELLSHLSLYTEHRSWDTDL